MKLNYKQPQVFIRIYVYILLLLGLFLAIFFFGCTTNKSKVVESRSEQLARRTIILSEYQAKYGDDYSTWTDKQKQELKKAYGK